MNAETQDSHVELERLVAAGRDALTDDMIGRLATTASEAIELLDRVNRSGLEQAIPVIAEMVNNGDLARLAQIARVFGSAEDALTDDMIGRLTAAVGGGLELIDQVHRAGLEKALPVLSRLVADGDLERIAHLARLIGSAEDAMTDDMVGRLAATAGEGMSMIDRITRGPFARLVSIVEHMDETGFLDRLAEAVPRLVEHADNVERLLGCLQEAGKEARSAPPQPGGIGGLWRMMRDPDSQMTLHFLLTLGRKMRTACGSQG